ncbi:uncharacterized protein LOC122500690 [Leptopilina heterotoma]|uniref:uncharacterized protein LOC122500690 n=1 Tax=Leptopilina heterotoma TaxID=63436 RepID=UPI001CAA09B0|nr:uncharacterized protein LOC122500690 [Leptopilina heterotoma]
MDTSFRSFYMMNEKLLRAIGQWPYQMKLKKVLFSTLVYISLISLLIPELLGLKKHWGNLDIVIECIPPLIILIIVLLLLTNFIIKMEKIELIFSKMKRDWVYWRRDSKIEILHAHTRRGKDLNKLYIIYIAFTSVGYFLLPIVPQLLNMFHQNQSVVKQTLYFTDYYVDEEQYYLPIVIHSYISSITCMHILTSIEITFSSVIQHACGVYSVLGAKLENLLDDDFYARAIEKKIPQEIDKEIRMYVQKHLQIIEFVDDICDCFSTSFFLILGCNTIIISVTGVQTVIKLDKLDEALRFGTFTLSQIIHLLYLSIPCQQLIDHSLSLSASIYNGYWYQLSLESQKMLLFIMKRSSKPSEFTAGKLFTFSMNNFASVSKIKIHLKINFYNYCFIR